MLIDLKKALDDAVDRKIKATDSLREECLEILFSTFILPTLENKLDGTELI